MGMRELRTFCAKTTQPRPGHARNPAKNRVALALLNLKERMRQARNNGCARGFTLVEMLTVIAIIGLLASLILPAVQKAKPRAERVRCLSNLRQVGIAFHAFANDHGDRFPMQLPAKFGGSREFTDVTNLPPDDLALKHFQTLARDLGTPAVLACPADTRRPALSFGSLQTSNLSYFVAARARYGQANALLSGDRNLTNDWLGPTAIYPLDANNVVRWTHELHRFKGNLLYTDGHAEQWNNSTLLVAGNGGVLPDTLILPGVTAVPLAGGPSSTTPAATSASAAAAEKQTHRTPPPGTASVPLTGQLPKIVRVQADTPIGIRTDAQILEPRPEPPPAAPKEAVPPPPTVAPVTPAPIPPAPPPPPPAQPHNPVQFLVTEVNNVVRSFYWVFVLLLALLIAWRVVHWYWQRQERVRPVKRRDDWEE